MRRSQEATQTHFFVLFKLSKKKKKKLDTFPSAAQTNPEPELSSF